jgi:outer membrane protein
MKTTPFHWSPVLIALMALSTGTVRAEGLKLSREMVVPPSVQAATAQYKVVTLLRAYELALEKDRTYAAAQAAYRAMQEKVPQARAALRPNVALSAGLTASTRAPASDSRLSERVTEQTDTRTTAQTTASTSETTTYSSPTRDGVTTATQTSSDTRRDEQLSETTTSAVRQSSDQRLRNLNAESAINLTWPLYRPSLSRQLEQSQLVEEQALLQLKAARQDVALRVARAYFDVLLARENLDALAVQKAAIEQQLAVAENSFEEGVVTIADVREAQAKKDAVLAQEVALRNALKVKNTALQALIGERADAVQQLRVDDLLSGFSLPGELNQWSAQAQEQAFEVQIEEIGLRIAQKELNKQSDAHKPTLDFVANLGANRSREVSRTRSNTSQTDQATTSSNTSANGTSNTTTDSSALGSSAANTSTDSTSQTNAQSTVDTSTSRPASRNRSYAKQWDAYIGVRLNIPLFDGGLTSSKVRESLALQEQKEIDLQRVRAEAALAAETAYLEAAGFFAEAQALKAAETSGRVALEANQMGYEVGLRINSDVLNAQQQLFTTRRDLMRAQVDALVATLRLKASVGGLGETKIQELDKWLK